MAFAPSRESLSREYRTSSVSSVKLQGKLYSADHLKKLQQRIKTTRPTSHCTRNGQTHNKAKQNNSFTISIPRNRLNSTFNADSISRTSLYSNLSVDLSTEIPASYGTNCTMTAASLASLCNPNTSTSCNLFKSTKQCTTPISQRDDMVTPQSKVQGISPNSNQRSVKSLTAFGPPLTFPAKDPVLPLPKNKPPLPNKWSEIAKYKTIVEEKLAIEAKQQSVQDMADYQESISKLLQEKANVRLIELENKKKDFLAVQEDVNKWKKELDYRAEKNKQIMIATKAEAEETLRQRKLEEQRIQEQNRLDDLEQAKQLEYENNLEAQIIAQNQQAELRGMKRILEENDITKAIKDKARLDEIELDKKLMQEYNDLLDANDKKRSDALAARLRKQEAHMAKMEDTTVKIAKEKLHEEERRLLQFQTELDNKKQQEEKAKEAFLNKRKEEIKSTLDQQLEARRLEILKEKEESAEIARQALLDVEKYNEEEKIKKELARKKAESFKTSCLQTIKEQHLKKAANSEEFLTEKDIIYNKDLLRRVGNTLAVTGSSAPRKSTVSVGLSSLGRVKPHRALREI